MLPAVPTLDAVEGRVVGSLIEKQLTTPQQYPLTLNALVLACNQSSNRDPVVAYGEDQVAVTLDRLKDRRLVRFVLPSHGRSVVRYRQVLDELLGIDEPQLAVLAVLLLRGPQTLGELRIRTDRMASFDGLEQVQHELDLLAGLEEPLVARLPRRPGQKEERWAERLAGSAPDADGGAGGQGPATAGEDPWSTAGRGPSGADVPTAVTEGADVAAPGTAGAVGAAGTAGEVAGAVTAGAIAELRRELARLGADVDVLKSELRELRDSLGG